MLLSVAPKLIEKSEESARAQAPSSACPVAPARLQRALGTARVSFKLRDGDTVLDGLGQSGCTKIRLPRSRDENPVAVLLNTAGGITGGDRLDYSARWASGTRATVTSQTAERIYRRFEGVGEVSNTLHVRDGASAEWLPQETIVFDRSGLNRTFTAHLEGSARLLALETVVLGRKAMGETVTTLSFRDRWRVYRDGRLCFADDTRLIGDAEDILSGPATGNGATCFAMLAEFGPQAMERLETAREILADCTNEAGASAWNGMLLIRFIASDSQRLRGDLIHFLERYRAAPLPRVWHC
ncbi:urease accessory protein [Breoghania sp. L-A4]|nr:urease accessory protein [Breoghania sp. L-A4]